MSNIEYFDQGAVLQRRIIIPPQFEIRRTNGQGIIENTIVCSPEVTKEDALDHCESLNHNSMQVIKRRIFARNDEERCLESKYWTVVEIAMEPE